MAAEAPGEIEPKIPVSSYVALLGIFFLSGYCALTYEVAWTRLLDHVFGVSVFATTTVLATFMAGLALGALLAGLFVDRTERPLRAYAIIECAIGVCAFLTPVGFALIEPLYGWAFRSFEGMPIPLTAARAFLGFLALIAPASLMGATFPFMTRALVRRSPSASRDLGLLYGMNTLGGVVGCLSAAFVLLVHLGTSWTIYVSGALNLVAAFLALALGRRAFAARATHEFAAAPTPAPALPPLASALLVAALFASGFLSLAYEVLWFRGLVGYVYNSTYAFSLMLAMFLVGLALGGLICSALPSRLRNSLAFVGTVTVLTGVAFWISGLLFPDLRTHAHWLLGNQPINSWLAGLALITVECALVLLVPATLLGVTFPASLHLLTVSAPRFGARTGALYSLNTVGGILGSITAGFLLIPLLGLRASLLGLIAIQVAIGLTILASSGHRAATMTALVVLGLGLAVGPWPPARMFVDTMNLFPRENRIIFYHEGISDSTAVVERIKTGDRVVVYADGRGTAGTTLSEVQKFFGHAVMLLHPNPTDVLNICFGVGNSLSAVIKYDPERVDVVELSSHVALTAPFFWTNEGVLNDPRVRLIAEDGAAYVRHTDQRYDVITLEPPEIHTAGVVNLYTRDFYENAARTLKPGGVLEQWITTSQIPEPELKMMLRSFLSAFPYSVVFTQLYTTNLVTIGSKQPIALDIEVLRRWWQKPAVADALRKIGIDSPERFLSYLVADQEQLWEYVGRDGPMVTDDRTFVDFTVPRSPVGGYGFGIFNPAFRPAYEARMAEDRRTFARMRAHTPLERFYPREQAAPLQLTLDEYRRQRRE